MPNGMKCPLKLFQGKAEDNIVRKGEGIGNIAQDKDMDGCSAPYYLRMRTSSLQGIDFIPASNHGIERPRICGNLQGFLSLTDGDYNSIVKSV